MDIASIISAVLFWTSSCLRAVQMKQWKAQPNFNYSEWKKLDAEYLQEQWEFRIQQRPFEMATGMLNAFAWFTFSIPILHVVWLQSSLLQGKRMISIHVAIALMAIGGALTEILARLFYIGSSSTMEWIVKDFELDSWLKNGGNSTDHLGWKSLEVTHIAMMGILTWVDAFEYLFLSFIFLFLFISIWFKSEPRLFSLGWAQFGMLLAFLSIIDFAADIMRYQNWRKYSLIAFWISSINRLVLFPFWLVWLSFQIPRAEALLEEASKPTKETEHFTRTRQEEDSELVVVS